MRARWRDHRRSDRLVRALLGGAGIAGIAGVIIVGGIGVGRPTEGEAYRVFRAAVREHLLNPAEARFADRDEVSFRRVGDGYRVVGWVETRTRRGEPLRRSFRCQVVRSGLRQPTVRSLTIL